VIDGIVGPPLTYTPGQPDAPPNATVLPLQRNCEL
jgi:hypothetical protein